METVYYTLTARGVAAEGELEQAAGGGRRVLLVRGRRPGPRRTGGDNVVDLAAWRSAREEGAPAPEPEPEPEPGPARPEREGRAGPWLLAGEALSTLAVLAVAAALLLRVLTF